jgi:hypothetical protein
MLALPESPTLPAPLAVSTAPRLPGAHSATAWRRLAQALGWPKPARGAAYLAAARRACTDCLADLPPLDVRALCHLLANAESSAELWHLRPEIYRVLALHHSQAEAERRLAATAPLLAWR